MMKFHGEIETNCGKAVYWWRRRNSSGNRDKLWKCNLNGDDDEITRWNRDYLWDHKSSLKSVGIPMRERDKLWKSNLNGDDDEIPNVE